MESIANHSMQAHALQVQPDRRCSRSQAAARGRSGGQEPAALRGACALPAAAQDRSEPGGHGVAASLSGATSSAAPTTNGETILDACI